MKAEKGLKGYTGLGMVTLERWGTEGNLSNTMGFFFSCFYWKSKKFEFSWVCIIFIIFEERICIAPIEQAYLSHGISHMVTKYIVDTRHFFWESDTRTYAWLLNCFPGEKWHTLLTEDKTELRHLTSIFQQLQDKPSQNSNLRQWQCLFCSQVCNLDGVWQGHFFSGGWWIWWWMLAVGWNTYMWSKTAYVESHAVRGSNRVYSKKEPGGRCLTFYDLTLEVTQHHFLFYSRYSEGTAQVQEEK